MPLGIGLLRRLTPRLLAWQLSVNLVVVLWIAPAVGLSDSNTDPEVFGLRFGMSSATVRGLFENSGIPLTETSPRELSAPRPLGPLEGVQEVRVQFDKDQLRKIVISFQIPPRESTANNLLLLYNKEKDRLKQLFGPSTLDFVDMKAPSPTDRHEWLTRGWGYYRAVWKVKDRVDISLWLYGEEGGILLMEMYEMPESP